MLSDRDVEKLCYGRLIHADVLNSAGTDHAGPHWAVMLDPNEWIAENHTYVVAPISQNAQIDSTFIVPVPPRTRLKGNIICSWLPDVDLPGILDVGIVLVADELRRIRDMISKYNAYKRSTQK